MLIQDVKKAAELLREGKIVIFPTETVWGIGADAKNTDACQKIYRVKERPSDNPLIIHLAKVEEISKYGEISDDHLKAVSAFIPGPLTIILKKRDPQLFSCGLETVAIRIPSCPRAQEFLQEFGGAVAAPSANISSQPSITRLSDILETFDSRVDAILSGDDSQLGLESTVIDLSKDQPIYIRPGMVSLEQLQKHLPTISRYQGSQNEAPPSPGMKYRHYAPSARVRLTSSLCNLETATSHKKIGFEPNADQLVDSNESYAQELYSFFIACDREGIEEIWCQAPQPGHLYDALMNRLLKASNH